MPYDERDDESGKFTPTFPDAAFLSAIRERDGATTAEVADAVGCEYRSAYDRLHDLDDEGRVNVRKIGNTLLWTLAPGPQTAECTVGLDDDHGDHDHAPAPDRDDDTAGVDPDPEPDTGLDAVDFPEGRPRDECVAAVEAAHAHLREHGGGTMREIVATVMPEHPIGYDLPEIVDGDLVADRYRGAWWRRIVRPGLEALDDVAKPPKGGSKWRYRGEGDA